MDHWLLLLRHVFISQGRTTSVRSSLSWEYLARRPTDFYSCVSPISSSNLSPVSHIHAYSCGRLTYCSRYASVSILCEINEILSLSLNFSTMLNVTLNSPLCWGGKTANFDVNTIPLYYGVRETTHRCC